MSKALVDVVEGAATTDAAASSIVAPQAAAPFPIVVPQAVAPTLFVVT